jgi:hypothetical protein
LVEKLERHHRRHPHARIHYDSIILGDCCDGHGLDHQFLARRSRGFPSLLGRLWNLVLKMNPDICIEPWSCPICLRLDYYGITAYNYKNCSLCSKPFQIVGYCERHKQYQKCNCVTLMRNGSPWSCGALICSACAAKQTERQPWQNPVCQKSYDELARLDT